MEGENGALTDCGVGGLRKAMPDRRQPLQREEDRADRGGNPDRENERVRARRLVSPPHRLEYEDDRDGHEYEDRGERKRQKYSATHSDAESNPAIAGALD